MTPRLRRALILLAAGLAIAAGAGIWAWARRPEPEPYRATESVEGLTSKLDRTAQSGASPIRFTDVTAEAGLRFVHFGGPRSGRLPEDMGPGAAWGDVDGDGDDDLFLPNFSGALSATGGLASETGPTHALYRNRGDGTFEDVSAASGLAQRGTALGAAFGDCDGDGDADLAVTQFGRCLLFLNDGTGVFEDASEASGIGGPVGFWTGASWADFDGDGDLDLHACGYVTHRESPADAARATRQYDVVIPFMLNPSSFEPERNLLFRNDGRGRFEEIAEAAGVANPGGRSLSATWADFDEDGRLDLYVANDVSDNALFMNLGDGTFADRSHEAWVADYRGAMGLGVGDFDGDLDLDIFITHWIAQENALYRSMLRDRAGHDPGAPLRFVDVADREGLGQIALSAVGWGTELADFDGDGRLDVFVVNGSTFQEKDDPARLVPMQDFVFWNQGEGRGFVDVAAQAGQGVADLAVGRGAAFSDYDLDGDVDVIVARHGAPPQLLRNESGSRRSWLAVRLADPAALGSRLDLEAGGLRLVRLAGGSSSYLSGSSAETIFGLGDATRVDMLTIRRPDGSADVARDLPVNARVVIEKGGAWRVVSPLATVAPGPAPATATAPALAAERAPAPAMAPALGEHGEMTLAGPASARDAGALQGAERAAFWDAYRAAQRARQQGDAPGAVARYREALALAPRHEDSLYWLGNVAFDQDDFATAGDAWTALAAANPASSRAHHQIGVLHSTPDPGAPFELALAEASFRRALALNPEESGALIRLGEVLLVQDRPAEALAVLQDAARLNPKSAAAHYAASRLLAQAGRDAEALDAMRRALAALAEEPHAVGLGEGDTQERLRALRHEALRRSFLAPAWDGLPSRVQAAALDAALMRTEHERLDALVTVLRSRR